MEYITIRLPRQEFDEAYKAGLIPNYEVKSVIVKDSLFQDDSVHAELKKRADKAYKELQEYEFKKRHNIP